MKVILIRIGKVVSVIKKDGILKGGKRVVKSFASLFRKVNSGNILFITGGVGDSALYRDFHYSEELNANGFRCSVTVQDNPFLLRYADKFKVFIFHRVVYTSKIKKFIRNIKAAGGEIIFETDDLVFDPKYLKFMDFFNNMNAFERKFYENGVGGEILKDPYVKVCTTTTEYLADKLRGYDKKVFIVKNKLSKSDVEICEKILQSKVKSQKSKVKLGYFSGTLSHNKDFAVITDALMKIMEENQNVELFLAGPLDIENKLNKFADRVKQLPYVPRSKHFENVSKVDVNLAPLEIGNPFCESKSELKFFEAGILGIPTVASATGTFKDVILDGVDGFVASDTEEWTSKLERLISRPELRFEMGQKAREKTLSEYFTTNAKNVEYYDYLRSKL